ncbi:MAG: TetR/AcrR family transcriptional regulator [Bacteroidetes bacterium]|nr:TetR/AcrR family transcriptional regulator [Bacteroidota bacterium]
MTTTDRREREKEQMRRRIMDAAMELFVKEGYGSVSMRYIAAAIEYSPATIYLYFRDKDDIFYALLQDGFRLLTERQEAVQSITDPLERLAAHGRAYVDFALEHPELYEIMFSLRGPEVHMKADADFETTGDSYGILRRNVRECQEVGHFAGQHPEIVAFALWSLVHGAASLSTNGRMDMLPPEMRRMLLDGFKDMLPWMMGRESK